MAIDRFDEILNTICIAKKLYDIGKYEIVEKSFCDVLDQDTYYENIYELMYHLFEYYCYQYYEKYCSELHILSDKNIVNFYILAGEYGKKYHICEEYNPYMKQAEEYVRKQLNFCYCIDWTIMVHTEPKRPFHSRIALLIYQYDWVDLYCLAYRLIEIYKWFSDACICLKNILNDTQYIREEVIAA